MSDLTSQKSLGMDPIAALITRVDKFVNSCLLSTEDCCHLEARKIFIHIDMDAFFAAVETLLNPTLLNLPMAVGSPSMLSTANYKARQYGVSSAMPGYIARRLCPQLIIVPGKFSLYKKFSRQVMSILKEYDPSLKSYSLDEASLDITNHFFSMYPRANFSTEEEFYQRIHILTTEIRHRIEYETGLTCSAGVSYSRSLAKLSSNVNKPNGQFVLPFELPKVREWLSVQPVRRIQGVGKVTAQLLSEGYKIQNCQDVFNKRYILAMFFGEGHWQRLLTSAIGCLNSEVVSCRFDDTYFTNNTFPKSISIDRTLQKSSSVLSEIETALFHIAELLEEQLALKGFQGNCITLKIKTADFETKTRAKTLSGFIENDAKIFIILVKPLLLECMPCEARLLGIRISGLAQIPSTSADSNATCTYRTLNPFLRPLSDLDIDSNLMVPTCSVCGHSNARFRDSMYFEIHQKECNLRNKIWISPEKNTTLLPFEKTLSNAYQLPSPLSKKFPRSQKVQKMKPENLFFSKISK
jgi:DNA polymerase kappa